MIFEEQLSGKFWSLCLEISNYDAALQGQASFALTFGLMSVLPIVFVKDYGNADLQKQQILLENKGKAGIYCWQNLIPDGGPSQATLEPQGGGGWKNLYRECCRSQKTATKVLYLFLSHKEF
jgi:hypothetical protein